MTPRKFHQRVLFTVGHCLKFFPHSSNLRGFFSFVLVKVLLGVPLFLPNRESLREQRKNSKSSYSSERLPCKYRYGVLVWTSHYLSQPFHQQHRRPITCPHSNMRKFTSVLFKILTGDDPSAGKLQMNPVHICLSNLLWNNMGSEN